MANKQAKANLSFIRPYGNLYVQLAFDKPLTKKNDKSSSALSASIRVFDAIKNKTGKKATWKQALSVLARRVKKEYGLSKLTVIDKRENKKYIY